MHQFLQYLLPSFNGTKNLNVAVNALLQFMHPFISKSFQLYEMFQGWYKENRKRVFIVL